MTSNGKAKPTIPEKSQMIVAFSKKQIKTTRRIQNCSNSDTYNVIIDDTLCITQWSTSLNTTATDMHSASETKKGEYCDDFSTCKQALILKPKLLPKPIIVHKLTFPRKDKPMPPPKPKIVTSKTHHPQAMCQLCEQQSKDTSVIDTTITINSLPLSDADKRKENSSVSASSKKPMPLPRPSAVKTDSEEDIYDDVIVISKKPRELGAPVLLKNSPMPRQTHSLSATVGCELVEEDTYMDASSRKYLLEEDMYMDASSRNYLLEEDLYMDASSHKYSQNKAHNHQHDFKVPGRSYYHKQTLRSMDGPKEDTNCSLLDKNRTRHVFDNGTESFPVHSSLNNPYKVIDIDRNETPSLNNLTPRDYIYPSHSQQAIRPSHQSLEYDYAFQDISLSTSESTSEVSFSHGVFANRDYDYAYQHGLSSSPRLISDSGKSNHRYYYKTAATIDVNSLDSISPHSYETIDDIRHITLPESGCFDLSTHIENCNEAKLVASNSARAYAVATIAEPEGKVCTPGTLDTFTVSEHIPARLQASSGHISTQSKLDRKCNDISACRTALIGKYPLNVDESKLAQNAPDVVLFHQETTSVNTCALNSEQDVPTCDHLSINDYEEILSIHTEVDPKRCDQQDYETACVLDLPEQIRQRTTRLVNGPAKEKLHLSLKSRKPASRSSIFDMPHLTQVKISDRGLFPNGEIEAKDIDNDYDTIPSEKSRKVFDEANGIHLSESIISPVDVRRHSLSSSESQAELLTLSVYMGDPGNSFLQSIEFDRLKDLVDTELKDYKDAGIVHIRSRAQIFKDIKNLTENAPLFPPPLPGIFRSRSKLISKDN